jgi:LytS/YehU family sensor histidine kinase
LLLITSFYFVSDASNRIVFQYASNQRNAEAARNPADTFRYQGANTNRQDGDFRSRTDSAGNISQTERRVPPQQGQRPPVIFQRFRRPPFRQMHLYNYAISAFFVTFFSLGLKVLERHSLIEKRQKELEKEKLNSELAFLKNQISPHFFFNTLNNIYSLIGINAEDSQKAVLQLSRMMRYLLYESEHGETLLSSEIEFMNNYIDLMRLRMSEKVRLDVEFPAEFEDVTIPPLLFIPIIENAFKHGISYREKSFISIVMKASREQILFICSNSIVKAAEEPAEHSGIGLENLKKRLNLIFPDRHEFKIDKTASLFEVTVSISLRKA